MSNRFRWLTLSLLGMAVSGGLLWYAEGRTPKVAVASTQLRLTPAQMLDSNIVFYEGVARRDPTGGMALGTLALFYMRRARATGEDRKSTRLNSSHSS